MSLFNRLLSMNPSISSQPAVPLVEDNAGVEVELTNSATNPPAATDNSATAEGAPANATTPDEDSLLGSL